MGEIKELEEARGAIIDIIFTNRTTNVAHELAGQILNLRGDGWKIAIVGNWSYTSPGGGKYAPVIWQGE